MRNQELILMCPHILKASVASAQFLKKKLRVHLCVLCVCDLRLCEEGPIYGVINSLACSQSPGFICHTLIKSISLLDIIIEGDITC